MKIVQFSTVHAPFDIRIFLKESRSLAAAGHDVTLLVHHNETITIDGVHIVGLSPLRSRLLRMTIGMLRMACHVILRKADVYHFHDAELLPLALVLRCMGRTVIYDVHEDLPRQILGKFYIRRALRKLIAAVVERVENIISRRCSAVVAATPAIAKRFEMIGCRRVIPINNFADLQEFAGERSFSQANREPVACYVGGISAGRGAFEMVKAAGLARIPLALAGGFAPDSLRSELTCLEGWSFVRERGHLTRDQVALLFRESTMALVLFRAAPNHEESQPNKLFEYMSASLPVISSNFPLWRSVVEDRGCGICVDPADSGQIATAMRWLAEHPDEAVAMGQRGRRAVEEHYSWQAEVPRLLQLYDSLRKSSQK
jgi:glycosyltransferase involved in cell wall biosynthesis